MNTNQHTPVNSSATVANNYLARSLRQLQSTTFLHCMEHSRKTINTSPPVYTGMTALRLAGIETPLCSRFEAVKFQVLYVGEPTKRSGRKDTSYLKCPPSLTGIAHLTWTHDNITIVYTHPLMTWALLAPYLTQIEVIVLADAILRASSGSMTVANISRFLDGADAFPGRRKCIDALVFLDAVTDSTMECPLHSRDAATWIAAAGQTLEDTHSGVGSRGDSRYRIPQTTGHHRIRWRRASPRQTTIPMGRTQEAGFAGDGIYSHRRLCR